MHIKYLNSSVYLNLLHNDIYKHIAQTIIYIVSMLECLEEGTNLTVLRANSFLALYSGITPGRVRGKV